MRINLKKPRYIVPLLIMPFLLLIFYVYQSNAVNKENPVVQNDKEIQGNIGDVSKEVQKKALSDKLDAYRGEYKEGDGYTAINPLAEEVSDVKSYGTRYTQSDKSKLDSFKFGSKPLNAYQGNTMPKVRGSKSKEDQALAEALARLSEPNKQPVSRIKNVGVGSAKEKDPMDLFKSQMSYMDSVTKASDPEYQKGAQSRLAMDKAEELRKNQVKLSVQKGNSVNQVFNSIFPDKKETFINAIIDENITGYAGSRIRIRLLEDIKVGRHSIGKGSYLYANINGFSEQRVMLTIKSILSGNKLLPVRLDLYDTDGLLGLYVPESAFREFTKDLSGNSMQGVNLQGNAQNQNQFLMSTIDKVFQSTSSAIASLIRKNKAKIKYSSYVYLIDSDELQNAQKNY